MIQIPTNRSTLVKGPWIVGLSQCLVSALFLWPTLGPPAFVIAACTGAVFWLTSAYLLYRSDYGALHMAVAASLITIFMATPAAGIAAAVVVIGGYPDRAAWVLVGVGLGIGCVWVWSAMHLRSRLRAAGPEDPWTRGTVDLTTGTVRMANDALSDRHALSASRFWIGFGIVNIPLLLRVYGIDLTTLLPWLAVAMIAASGAVVARVTGPMLGRALCLRDLEREHGLHFSHAELPSLQRLRASYWLSRWWIDPRSTTRQTPPARSKRA